MLALMAILQLTSAYPRLSPSAAADVLRACTACTQNAANIPAPLPPGPTVIILSGRSMGDDLTLSPPRPLCCAAYVNGYPVDPSVVPFLSVLGSGLENRRGERRTQPANRPRVR